ncbi:MAG: Alkylmercury lyase [Methanoregula sp. PtaU1.Bin006]|jgi:hypothetical protein|uniref:organomercurial lyase n=1 Tax=Methanoregula sp. PtaU1.Bin006 TaxID=1811681 RepID=UPI0009D37B02|nr:organomercurial lyase [Methanoregula sp. PtaU1.Bin006]OPY35652.1 MAG: Alkylmercury lyase [Methanoregula sp. PtaU1.Bin006]
MTRLMDTIGESVRDRCKNASLNPQEDEIRKCILRFFAKTGNPPTVKEIAEIVAAPPDVINQTIRKLRQADVLTTQAGVITSIYPFSAVKTRHTVVFADGHSVNALCATDALGVHFMLGEDITFRSLCPECGCEISIVLKGGRVISRDPTGAVEYAKARDHYGCTAETCCPHINLFCGRDHVDQWRAKNPAFSDGEVYEIEEAMEDGRMIFGEFLK